jgi:NADH:ubiquinone oxidoreductase subunit 2 (subunit N)
MLIIISPQESSILIILIAILRALVGGIGGLNQAQLRALLAYSSIGHIG